MTAFTRRQFTKFAVMALPASGALSLLPALPAAEGAKPSARPDSRVRGVHIGLNVPYSFRSMAMNGDEILAGCVALGVSAVELRTQPVELFLGAPADLLSAKSNVATGGAAQATADKLREWRLSAPLARVADFRRQYEQAGVQIEIVKVDRIFQMKDDVLDYTFKLAKALGGRAISTEISKDEKDMERLGHFADKHQFPVGYHGHATTTPEHWLKAFSFAKYNYANVDLGHFVAGNNASPVPFIKEHHARITHVHVKDRKMKNGANFPFGEGDTPIVEVLRLIRDQKWPIQATIEYEYKVPAGSTVMAELARTVKYCRDALAS